MPLRVRLSRWASVSGQTAARRYANASMYRKAPLAPLLSLPVKRRVLLRLVRRVSRKSLGHCVSETESQLRRFRCHKLQFVYPERTLRLPSDPAPAKCSRQLGLHRWRKDPWLRESKLCASQRRFAVAGLIACMIIYANQKSCCFLSPVTSTSSLIVQNSSS